MAYLQFEAMGVPRVKTELSVAYIDHNTIQSGFENADDHKYLETVTKKHGVRLSKPGNGVCHQVHLERFAVPGKTLLGSDSHTPTAGGLGMLAIGAGGLDVAVAMSGGAYSIPCPSVTNIKLTGNLAARRGCQGRDFGGAAHPDRQGRRGQGDGIHGRGREKPVHPRARDDHQHGRGAGRDDQSIFPADANARQFMKAQGREQDFVEMLPSTPTRATTR